MGLFSSLGGTLESGLSTYVTGVSAGISSALVPVVTTALTIWVLTYGMAVMRGEAHEAVPAFSWRAVKVAIILAFALGTGVYQGYVVTAVNGATTGLVQTIQSAAQQASVGGSGCTASTTSDSGVYGTLDCYDTQISLVMDAYGQKASADFPNIGLAFADVLCALVAGFGGSVFLIVLAFEVVMARMMLDLVLGLGPLFIACAAFAPTARFFEAWTSKVANYALLQVLIAAFLGMALTAFASGLTTLQVSAGVSAVKAALEGDAAIADAFLLFVSGVFLAMVGLQLPGVATGLAGGATLSGFSAFVGGAVGRVVPGAVGKALQKLLRKNGGGSVRNGGDKAGGPGGSGSKPAYQRAAHDQLGKDN